MKIAEQNPEALQKKNKGDLDMCINAKRTREKTPVHMLKREDISLEGEAARKHAGDLKKFSHPQEEQEFEGSPHSAPAEKTDSFYSEHGRGKGKPTGAQKESGQKISKPSLAH